LLNRPREEYDSGVGDADLHDLCAKVEIESERTHHKDAEQFQVHCERDDPPASSGLERKSLKEELVTRVTAKGERLDSQRENQNENSSDEAQGSVSVGYLLDPDLARSIRETPLLARARARHS